MEIDSPARLEEWLAAGRPLRGVRLQDLDLTGPASRLLGEEDVSGLVVLGGTLSPELRAHLQDRGAVVFPGAPEAPVDVFRARLYTPAELYAGLDGPSGYAGTVDARAYAWSRDRRLARDAYATLLRAIHDDSVSDALEECLRARRVVGILGGHALERGSGGYAAAAQAGYALAEAGVVVATGGGPGAMEAANLGAAAPSRQALMAALDRLGRSPGFDDVTRWAGSAFDVLDALPVDGTTRRPPQSVGIPTWFYGHEPPNVFADAIAKYFSNAVREDGLLARSNAGVLVLPGAAGTVQEVFQLATRLFYALPGAERAPMVLVGASYWTDTFPVWPLVRALGTGRSMARVTHLVDDVGAGVDLLIGG